MRTLFKEEEWLTTLAEQENFRMLDSKRVKYVPLFHDDEGIPWIHSHGRQSKKYFDIEATKSYILEKYQASVDVFNHNRVHHYVGQVSEEIRYKWKRLHRASLSCVKEIEFERTSTFFHNGVINASRVSVNRNRAYKRDLETLLPD